MRTRRYEQYVAAPIEWVYAAYVDPALMPKWMELAAVTDLSGPLDQAGTWFTQVYRGRWRFRTQVLRAEPPTLHEMAGRAPLRTTYRWLARFAPDGEGTHVTLESETRIFGPLDLLAQRLFDASARASARRHLADLAVLVEAAPLPGAEVLQGD